MEKLIEKIEKLTKDSGKTGKELGFLLGLKKSPLTDWKNKKAKPTLEQFIKICEIFEISADELLETRYNKTYTEEEKQLIEYFRNCNSSNKTIIINATKSLQEPEQDEGEKQSTLKTG